MGRYQNYSKEELIAQIEKLEAENKQLHSLLYQGDHSEKIGISERFKDKYASKILDSLPDMLTVLTNSGELVDLVSSEWTNHVGEPSSKLIGRNIATMLPEEASRNIKNNLDIAVTTQNCSIAHHMLPVGDKIHYFENRIFPLDDQYVLCMCRDVTEENLIKDTLEVTNRKMEAAKNMASLSHWYFYKETNEIEAPGILPLLFNVSDCNIRCSADLYIFHVHPDDRETLMMQFMGKKESCDYIEHRILINGMLHYFHTRIIHRYEKDGVHVIEGYAQDMTYVIERFHELENLKYAVNKAGEEIFACRLDGSLTFANQQFINKFQISDPINQTKIYDIDLYRESWGDWQNEINKIRKNGGSYNYTLKNKSEDQVVEAFDVITYIIKDHSNEEIVWFFVHDISMRVKHENEIRQLNYLMDAILNNIPVYLFVKDPSNEFRYLYWNKAFEDYSHIPASKALGKMDCEIFPNAENAKKFRKDDLALLRGGERLEFFEDYETADGETRSVKTSKALVPSQKKLPLIIGVSWDITDLKNTEKALIAARVKAEQSDKLKTAFLANMSHEIRTPLNAIVGFSRLIAETENPEEKRQYSNIIDTNSELLLQLINDILDISKIEAGSLEFINKTLNLSDLCKSIYNVHKPRVKKGVVLKYEEKWPELKITGDQNRIAQIITNLITNAIKFTSEGSIVFGFDIKNNMIYFYVKDTGPGIPMEKQKSIFDRFIKLDRFAQGTGLGLAISRMIVEKIGGHIWVNSEENVGSTFCFEIPYISCKSQSKL